MKHIIMQLVKAQNRDRLLNYLHLWPPLKTVLSILAILSILVKVPLRFYNKIIRDTREEGYGKITVKEVFEKSSNVGTSKLIYEHYKDNPKDFVNRLYAMKLNEKLDLQIKGEGDTADQVPGR